MHNIFDNKSGKFIFSDPKDNFLWHGRMLFVLRSFDKKIIDDAISLDKFSLAKIFDLGLLYQYAQKNNNENLLTYLQKIPGANQKGEFSHVSQFHHLLLMNKFAAIIYFYQNKNIESISSVSALSFIYDKISDITDLKAGFKEITGTECSHETLRKDFNI
jgi:hypothetical protein